MRAESTTNEPSAAPPLERAIDLHATTLGLAWLCAGVLVYVLARPNGVQFLPAALDFDPLLPDLLVRLSGPLPIFFHVGAMSYLTIGLLGLGRRGALFACCGWAALDIAFEFGQHESIASSLAAFYPHPRFQSYFLNGTFDALDVLAAILAATFVRALTTRAVKTGTGL